jgi:hypothetical protein
MLLKWLFTLLAIVWLYQALRPFFIASPPPPQAPPPPSNPGFQPKKADSGDGEYIDYEEVK